MGKKISNKGGSSISSKSKNVPEAPHPIPLPNGLIVGGKKINQPSYFMRLLSTLHISIMDLNNSKYFAGFVMILLNLGAKVVTVQFSKSTQEYLKGGLSKHVFVFSMAWMGTRDIYISLILTFAFIILSEYLFNEESKLCVVPEKYRVLNSLVDTNNDGVISDEELAAATKILEKARNAAVKQKKEQDLNK
jgi:hypothetical protein